MKSKLLNLVFIIAAIMGMSSCGYERIDAGHAGIEVNLYGDEKGVDDVTRVTGAQWYNPFRTEIHEFPLFVQNAEYTFTITSKDGLPVVVQVGLNYKVMSDDVVPVFKEYRQTLPELEQGILSKRTREAFSQAMNKVTAEESYAKKIEVLNDAREFLTNDLTDRGFFVEGLVYMNDPQPPASVLRNIEAKVNQQQEALKEQAKVQQAIFEAEKKEAQARGDSAALMINAHAEAEAMRIKQRQLSSQYVQYEMIQRWDGKLPTYGEVPTLFKDVANGGR